MKKLFLMVFFASMIVSPASAQSTLALQEKCAEGAKKFFFEHLALYGDRWGSFEDERGLHDNHYETHYNKKLDKCFIKIEYWYYPKDKMDATHVIEIGNVPEGKIYGSLFESGKIGSEQSDRLVIGNIGDKTYNSPKEFEALIKLYMEE